MITQGKSPVKKGKMNPLSLEPGGSILALEFSDGNVQVQSNIKSKEKYVGRILNECRFRDVKLVSVVDMETKEVVYGQLKIPGL